MLAMIGVPNGVIRATLSAAHGTMAANSITTETFACAAAQVVGQKVDVFPQAAPTGVVTVEKSPRVGTVGIIQIVRVNGSTATAAAATTTYDVEVSGRNS